MNKFKVGDIITGTNYATYRITTTEALMKVTRVYREKATGRTKATDRMVVRVIKHNGYFRVSNINENNEFDVMTDLFIKIPKLRRLLLFGK